MTALVNLTKTHTRMMKQIFLLTSCISLAATSAFAQPKKMLADKIIAVVGNKAILKSDIDNSLVDMQRQGVELPPNAACMTLEQTLGVKALVPTWGPGQRAGVGGAVGTGAWGTGAVAQAASNASASALMAPRSTRRGCRAARAAARGSP